MGDGIKRDRLKGIRCNADLVREYSRGFPGVYSDPEEREKFLDTMDYTVGMDAAAAFGWMDSGKGQLVIPFKNIEMIWPGSMPGPAQKVGDCVAHSTKNACLMTMTSDIVSQEPDEETGLIEGAPLVTPTGISEGVLATNAIYIFRGHNGDGWSCSHAGRVVCKESGMWLRKNYPEFGIDYTRYLVKNGRRWGRVSPPQKIVDFGMKHRIRQATELSSFDEVRDFLKNGFGISSCGGEGFSSRRDDNGVSKRRGGWSHAMSVIAADDRDAIKKKYGEPLVCILNSWGVWNSGGRKILGTTIDIPKGAFWAKWSDVRRRYFVAFSGASGWPARKLPDWGADYWSRLK